MAEPHRQAVASVALLDDPQIGAVSLRLARPLARLGLGLTGATRFVVFAPPRWTGTDARNGAGTGASALTGAPASRAGASPAPRRSPASTGSSCGRALSRARASSAASSLRSSSPLGGATAARRGRGLLAGFSRRGDGGALLLRGEIGRDVLGPHHAALVLAHERPDRVPRQAAPERRAVERQGAA